MIRTILAAALAALALSAPRPASAQAPEALTLRNATDTVVREVYLWAPPARDRGPDRLGAEVLRPGATFRIPLGRDAPCRQELRAVFEDGGEESRPVDVCAAREVTLDDANARPLLVVNDTDADLLQLFLATPGQVGPDRLGSAIVPGNDQLRIRLRGLQGCEFEARAVFRGARREASQRINVCAAERIAFGDAAVPLREANVGNGSTRTLRELYVGEDGVDRLGAQVLRPGQVWLLRTRQRDCRVRLRAVFDDDRAEAREVDLCGAAGTVIGFGAPQRLRVAHDHARPVRELYLSPVEARDWGADRLAGRPLSRGETREVTMEGGCRADLRIVFDNGNAEEARGLDICARPALTLRPAWVAE